MQTECRLSVIPCIIIAKVFGMVANRPAILIPRLKGDENVSCVGYILGTVVNPMSCDLLFLWALAGSDVTMN